jgi:hypothetical protein
MAETGTRARPLAEPSSNARPLFCRRQPADQNSPALQRHGMQTPVTPWEFRENHRRLTQAPPAMIRLLPE